MKQAISPDEFDRRMKEVLNYHEPHNSDEDIQHQKADKLMVLVLKSLGYAKGVAVFNAMEKWYA